MEHRQWVGDARNELKGLAMLWILFFHALFQYGGVLKEIQQIGYGGVDIFFFMTGFGLYTSLQRNGDIRRYTSRRLWRLLPAYLPIVIAWIIVMFPGYQLRNTDLIRSAFGNLLMVAYWFDTAKVFNWYVGALLLAMLLAPIVHAMLSRAKKPALTVLCLLIVCVGCGLACIGSDLYMGVSRLPIFILGMAFAMEQRPKLGKGAMRLLYAMSFVMGLAALLLCMHRYPELLNDFAMYWHPFVLITPPLCVGLAYLFHRAGKARAAFAPLRLIGQCSFEIYLVNIWMVELAKKYAVTGNLSWLLLCVGNLAVGILYHLLIGKLTTLLKRRFCPSEVERLPEAHA